MSQTPRPGTPSRSSHKGRPRDSRKEQAALRGQHLPDPKEEAVPLPEGPTEIISTDYQIGQNNIERATPVAFDVHNPVFAISAVVVVLFTAATLLFPDTLGPFFAALRDTVTSNFDWFFLISGADSCVTAAWQLQKRQAAAVNRKAGTRSTSSSQAKSSGLRRCFGVLLPQSMIDSGVA